MSMEELPKCSDCGLVMIKVGDIGSTVEIVRDGKIVGVRSLELYQCTKDKQVAVW